MLHLALDGSGNMYLSSRLSKAKDFGKNLEAIGSTLCKAKFLDSHCGKDGGYGLSEVRGLYHRRNSEGSRG